MKKLLSIFALLFTLSTAVNAQEAKINWISIEQAEAQMQKEPRKVLIDVYTTWCGPCKMMMKNTFTNKDVIEYINKNYYAVKFNAEGGEDLSFKGNEYSNPGFNPSGRGRNSQHQFAAALGVKSYPTIIYMDEELNVISPISGYMTPDKIELYLRLFAENLYKEITSQEDFQKYQANFKSTFQ